MSDELNVKIAVLEERIKNQNDRISEVSTQSELKHTGLRGEMEKRFEKMDTQIQELSKEVKTGFEQVKDIISQGKGAEKATKIFYAVLGLVGTAAISILTKLHFFP